MLYDENMSRGYKRLYKGDSETVYRFVLGITVLYGAFLVSLWFSNKLAFYSWLIFGVLVLVVVLGALFAWRVFKQWMYKTRMRLIHESIKRLGLDEQINHFIDRFGVEKKKDGWAFREHSFDWERLKDFRKVLKEKGLNISEENWDDLLAVLKFYIQRKEERLTRESIGLHQMKFSDLSGSEFENLLYRLFQAMGYIVQKTGKTGDQGGDLIANKDGEARMLIQAKCYNGSSVGNAAVQEAVAAQKFYDCNVAMVVTSSDYTREAIELAKVNNVWLVGKERLNELLLQYLKESWS